MEVLRTTDWLSSNKFQFRTSIMDNDADEVLHKHMFYEIFYIIEGNITHIYNGNQTELQKGDAVIIRFQDNHKFLRKNKQYCCHKDIIIGEQLFVNACDYLSDNLLSNLNSQIPPPRAKFTDTQIIDFENKLNEISCISAESNFNLKKTRVNVLLVNLINGFIEKEDKKNNLQPWLKSLLQKFDAITYLKAGLPNILKDIPYNGLYYVAIFT